MKTVLLVCSNKTLVMFIGILLKRMGFSFATANSGPDALGLIYAIQPDIVMIDSELAVFDGLETLERAKEGGPSVPPVIMMVGAPDEEAERRCIKAGACTVITKPVAIEDLHSALQECLFRADGMMRTHVRARANIRVTVYHDGSETELLTESISAGGAFIRHDKSLTVGTIVDLFMPFGDNECIFLTGKVIYNQEYCGNATALCPGFAVKFVDISAQDVDAIRDFVSRFITEDIIGLHNQGTFSAEGAAGSKALNSPETAYSAMHS